MAPEKSALVISSTVKSVKETQARKSDPWIADKDLLKEWPLWKEKTHWWNLMKVTQVPYWRIRREEWRWIWKGVWKVTSISSRGCWNLLTAREPPRGRVISRWSPDLHRQCQNFNSSYCISYNISVSSTSNFALSGISSIALSGRGHWNLLTKQDQLEGGDLSQDDLQTLHRLMSKRNSSYICFFYF